MKELKGLPLFVGRLIIFMLPTMFFMFVGSVATSAVIQHLQLVNFEKDLVLYLVGTLVGLILSKRRFKGD